MKHLLTALVLMFATAATAQNLPTYKHSLQQPDSIWGSSINLYEAADVTSSFGALAAKPKQSEIYGYRIEIFTDNSQSARAAAFKTREEFSAMYPNIPTKVSYDKLYWKVTVGQCASAEEAIALWGKIKQTYPKAFLARETFPIKELNK